MTGKRTLPVDAAGAGQRVDVFVARALDLPRARVKELFEEGAVRVDGRRARKGQLLAQGQTVTLPQECNAAPSLEVTPEPDAPLRVLKEDAHLLFLDKPAGSPCHPLAPGELGTVANALVARYPECQAASADPREGGLCHRLDVQTSGVLLAARDRSTWLSARDAFSQRKVDKRYWALVTGPLADEGEIDLFLRHARRDDRVEPAADGGDDAREAHSRFRVVARSQDYSLVEVQLVTGVLHQARAHLAAIGAPIVGDALYGGRADPELGRFFLHARSLELFGLRAESPLPDELARLLARLGLPTR